MPEKLVRNMEDGVVKLETGSSAESFMEAYIADIMKNGIPDAWSNTHDMQAMYSLAEKGFRKKVTWKMSRFGIGLFAEEKINAGEGYRKFVDRKNMIVFRSKADIPKLTEATERYQSHYIYQTKGMCGILIPGDSLNHGKSGVANTTLVKFVDSNNETGLLGVATKDIEAGEELLKNYEEHGTPPDWLLSFAKQKKIFEYMPFKGYNDFM